MISKSAKIHKFAVLDGNISVDDDVEIGPFCILKGKIHIGSGSKLMGCVLHGEVYIGKNCNIFYNATIGTPPQDDKYKGERSYVEIADNVMIRENVVISGGSDIGNPFVKTKNITKIGNNCYLMIGSHIGHNVILEDNVVLTNEVAIGGHSLIKQNVLIGGNTVIHQNIQVGEYSMIGGACAIASNVPPFALVRGEESQIRSINFVGMQRRGFDKNTINSLNKAYQILRSKESMNKKLDILKKMDSIQVQMVVNFIENNEKILQFYEKI